MKILPLQLYIRNYKINLYYQKKLNIQLITSKPKGQNFMLQTILFNHYNLYQKLLINCSFDQSSKITFKYY
jgi:hypothetical protein